MFARDFDLLRDDAVRRVMNRCSAEDVVEYVETKAKTTVGVKGFMILLDHFLQDIPRAMWAQEVISQARRRFAASGSIFPPSSCPDEIMTDLQLLRVVWEHREIIMQLAGKLSVSRLPSEDMDQTIKSEQEVQGLIALAAALQLPCEADIVRDLYIRSCTAPGLQIYSLIEWLVRVCKLCAPASEVASTFDEVLRRKPTAT
ncbi:Hypothetical Protein FCC1311_033402 [Hondaea fermentalgiana]|uniref:Uncharacterized protein n=1 Tax=Hondaea fermentalgiana TaxID=2315210 RepID=A0A2R5G7V5_9STRA|nr:Hypothetical Protein FCC1311_033402 [Hondaea fermentalgiana]|eukprot:GBG27117.1 Hypothetical Protein FCC1311_033402 [Hondaea fermentalgiana]